MIIAIGPQPPTHTDSKKVDFSTTTTTLLYR